MKGAYVVLTHTHVLINEPGPHKGKFQVHEMVEFVDRVRDKHASNATAIMDVLNRKLIKNRAKDSGATFELIEAHVVKGYGEKYRQFLTIVGAEIPEILQPKAEEGSEEEKPKKKRAKKMKEPDTEVDTD